MGKIRKEYKWLLIGIHIIFFSTLWLQQSCINMWKRQAGKNRGLLLVMWKWTALKQDHKNLEIFFENKNYKKIAVYGMSYVGISLIKELKNSKVEILYGIDKNAANIYSDIKILTPEENLPNVDAVVITLVEGYDEIYHKLSKKLKCDFLAIEDILNEI